MDGLGLDDEGRRLLATCDVVVHCAATVAFDAPLDTAVEINLLGPSAGRGRNRERCRIETRRTDRSAHPRTSSRSPLPMWPERTRVTPPRRSPRTRALGGQGAHALDRHHRGRHRRRGRLRPAPARGSRGRVAPARAPEAASPRQHAPSSDLQGPISWPNVRRSCATSGSTTSSSRPVALGPSHSAGPTRMPSRRLWVNGSSLRTTPWCRPLWCDPPSSSRRSPNLAPGGSAAFGWRSR